MMNILKQLIWSEVDYVGVDVMGVDLVRIDLTGVDLAGWPLYMEGTSDFIWISMI